MKQKIYILGLVTAIIVFLGTLFKVNHWPGAAILLVSGISILIFVFMPLALVSSYKAEGNKGKRLLYIVTWLTAFLIFTAMLFKIQHWAFSGLLMLVSIPFPFVVFLPVFLMTRPGNTKENIYSTVSVLFLLMIISCFTGLLALNVSKDKMVDSFTLVQNYSRSSEGAENLEISSQFPSIKLIDELIVMSQEYRDLYVGSSGYSPDMWKDELGPYQGSWLSHNNDKRFGKEKEAIHSALLSGLGDLVALLERTPGCESLAAAAPSVFNLRKTPGGNYNWDSDLLLAPTHPWLLVYLVGLENNLKLMKVSVK
ncbi:MAG: hypothetical protein RBS38_05415 [Bacteroidales bacterium]|jgi:hypothetical protein|nr:hypothetical protein [Bacteroidales bacterium]